MDRKGYLLVGLSAHAVASRYLGVHEVAVTEPPHAVALTDHLSDDVRKQLLTEAINQGLEIVPVQVELPENYSSGKYGFAIDPTVIHVRKDCLPAQPVFAADLELPPTRSWRH
jgi:hypothetical protein